jgi:helix-turn-helix protein
VSDTAGERVVADFVANFVAGDGTHREPVSGRVLMSDRRLVLVTGAWRTVIPLSSVVDVSTSAVPENVKALFDDALLVRYRQTPDAAPSVVVVGADLSTVDRFARLLYRSLVGGGSVSVRHPATVGGVAATTDWATGTLTCTPDRVTVTLDGGDSVTVELPDVVGVGVVTRRVDDGRERVLAVDHHVGGTVVTTELHCRAERHATLLSRLFRTAIRGPRGEAYREAPTVDDRRLLLAVHALGGDATPASLAAALGETEEAVETLLAEGAERRLLDADAAVATPTDAGLVLLFEGESDDERFTLADVDV